MTKWLSLAFVVLASACAGGGASAGVATEADATEAEDEVTTLSAEQQALAALAAAEIDAAAARFDGKPNLLVELSPKAGSKLTRVTAIPLDDEGVVKSALAASGASARGAARIAALVRSLRFRGLASLSIWSLAGGGFVLHGIDRVDECSHATVTAFDVEGNRVSRVSDGACS